MMSRHKYSYSQNKRKLDSTGAVSLKPLDIYIYMSITFAAPSSSSVVSGVASGDLCRLIILLCLILAMLSLTNVQFVSNNSVFFFWEVFMLYMLISWCVISSMVSANRAI